MLDFARGQEHMSAVRWLARPGTAEAAFIRFFAAQPAGHTLGQWRAEDDGQRWPDPKTPFSSAAARTDEPKKIGSQDERPEV
jgi:hypothetical protein